MSTRTNRVPAALTREPLRRIVSAKLKPPTRVPTSGLGDYQGMEHDDLIRRLQATGHETIPPDTVEAHLAQARAAQLGSARRSRTA